MEQESKEKEKTEKERSSFTTTNPSGSAEVETGTSSGLKWHIMTEAFLLAISSKILEFAFLGKSSYVDKMHCK